MSTRDRIANRLQSQTDQAAEFESAILPAVYRGNGKVQRLGQGTESADQVITSGAIAAAQSVSYEAGFVDAMPALRREEQPERRRRKIDIWIVDNANIVDDFLPLENALADAAGVQALEDLRANYRTIEKDLGSASYKAKVIYATLLDGAIYSEEQAAKIRSFVSAGGGLFIQADLGAFYQDEVNSISAQFGLQLLAGSEAFDNWTRTEVIHPVLDGPNGIFVTTNQIGGSVGGWDTSGVAEAGGILTELIYNAVGASIISPVAVAIEFGAGRIFAIADYNWAENETTPEIQPEYNYDFAQALWLNAFDWLLKRS